MSDHYLSKQLADLWGLSTLDREKGVKLLLKIFSKILSNPSQPKYADLNFSKIRSKLKNCTPCFYLLFSAGFKQSNDGKRLQWKYDDNNVGLLKKVTDSLYSKPAQQQITSNDDIKQKEHIEDDMKQKQKRRKAIKNKIAANRKQQKLEQMRVRSDAKLEQQPVIFMKQQIMASIHDFMSIQNVINENKEDEVLSISQLLHEGYSVQEAKNVIAMSLVDEENINKDHTENDKILHTLNYENSICVCGARLIKVNSVFDTNDALKRIECDSCSNDCNQTAQFYHCDSEQHKAGYNICEDCAYGQNQMDETYLLNPKAQIVTNCHILECESLIRIIDIFKQHNLCVKNKKIVMDIINTHTLLDDFQHLLFEHEDKFESIYDTLNQTVYNNKACNLSSCYLVKRNNRNRSELATKEFELSALYFSTNVMDIVKQQLIDIIHCYYLHSFHFGCRIPMEDRSILVNQNNEQKNEVDDTKLVNHTVSQKIFEYVRNKQRVQTNHRKFVTAVEETKSNEPSKYYSFGYRYFYSDKYKNSVKIYDDTRLMDTFSINKIPANVSKDKDKIYTLGDWYIPRKYEDLKEELLTNDICIISVLQWNIFLKKAQLQANTKKGKGLTNQSQKFNGIGIRRIESMESMVQYLTNENVNRFHDHTITQNHLVAMMVYCDEELLQQKLTETYRRIPFNESDESLKSRHSNYYHLGRLLRECVEDFGDENKLHFGDVYHGVNVKLHFASAAAKFHGPLSVTTDFAVAVGFCENKGMIIGFAPSDSMIGGQYFDCGWISSYPYEKEIFFIGGYSNFMMKTIIFPQGENFCDYVTALSQIIASFDMIPVSDGRKKVEIRKELQMIFRLLSHQLHKVYPDDKKHKEFKSIPKYVDILLNNQCHHIQSIYLILNEGNDLMDKLYKYLFFYDYGWIKIDLIAALFPSLKSIFYRDRKITTNLLLNSSLYESVLEYASNSNTNAALSCIAVDVGHEPLMIVAQNAVLKYQTSFKQLDWTLYLDGGHFIMQSKYHENAVEARFEFEQQYGYSPEVIVRNDWISGNMSYF